MCTQGVCRLASQSGQSQITHEASMYATRAWQRQAEQADFGKHLPWSISQEDCETAIK